MKICLFILICSLFCLSSGALAQVDAAQFDVGTSPDATVDDSGESCGTLTYQGECAEDTMRYCGADDTVETVECGTEGLTCGLYDCVEDTCYGYGCIARAGEDCSQHPCDYSQSLGCRGGVCSHSQTCDTSTYSDSCNGNIVLYCWAAQSGSPGMVWDFDCTWGGTRDYICGTTTTGTYNCLGLAGALCDPGQGVECAPELRCSNQGVCVTNSPDAGTVDAVSRDRYRQPHDVTVVTYDSRAGRDTMLEDRIDEEGGRRSSYYAPYQPPQKGCGCAATQGVASSLSVALLGSLLVLGVRRFR